VAAEASVGETIAHNKNASAHEKSGKRYLAAHATVTMVNITNPKESWTIGLILNLKSLHEVK
jgi:hypothetical protein